MPACAQGFSELREKLCPERAQPDWNQCEQKNCEQQDAVQQCISSSAASECLNGHQSKDKVLNEIRK